MRIEGRSASHDPTFGQEIIQTWKNAFATAVDGVSNIHNQHGEVEFGPGPTYEAYAVSEDAPVVIRTQQAANQIGLPINYVSDDGGNDANWIAHHGIPCVTLNIGQRNVHMHSEWIDLPDFECACQLVLAIALLG
ncbi:MAG: M20/M25/M40 family metallo-hydrolase [Woeseiaceae bacterium]